MKRSSKKEVTGRQSRKQRSHIFAQEEQEGRWKEGKRGGGVGGRPDSSAEAGAGDTAGPTCEQLESQVQGAENSLSRRFATSVIELPFRDH